MPWKILIADDEPALARILQTVLRSKGFEVFVARDGQEALDLTASEHPDLVLLDISMPKVSGYEVCQELKKNEATKAVSVFMLTAHAQKNDFAKGISLGADDYITKPFNCFELVEKITEFLKNKA